MDFDVQNLLAPVLPQGRMDSLLVDPSLNLRLELNSGGPREPGDEGRSLGVYFDPGMQKDQITRPITLEEAEKGYFRRLDPWPMVVNRSKEDLRITNYHMVVAIRDDSIFITIASQKFFHEVRKISDLCIPKVSDFPWEFLIYTVRSLVRFRYWDRLVKRYRLGTPAKPVHIVALAGKEDFTRYCPSLIGQYDVAGGQWLNLASREVRI